MNAVTGIKEKDLVRLNVVTGIKNMNNETKKGRGGARPNSGMKSSGIETVTVRIDKRLLNVVTEIKADFKNGKSLDDIISKPTLKNDDAKLLKKIAKLEREKESMSDSFFKMLESDRQDYKAEIEQLNETIHTLNRTVQLRDTQISILRSSGKSGGIDDKLRKRLVQFCHPDKHQDERSKAIAVELVQELNKLGG